MKPEARRFLLAAVSLAVLAVIPYLQTAGFDFVLYDDDGYVTGNQFVRAGLSVSGAFWAITTGSMATWHPLTWLSLMTDVSVFGANPGAMHIVNVLFHAAGAIVLLAILWKLTGHLGAAWFAAGFWALHPLRVESVAWVCQRKDVLSTFLGLLAVLCYVNMLKVENATTSDTRRSEIEGRPLWQILSFVLYVLAFMAKPTVVTFPALMVVLEYAWTGRVRWRHIELFVWAAVCGMIATIYTQNLGGAIAGITIAGPFLRVLNAIASIGAYLRQTVFPAGLAVHYPFCLPSGWDLFLGCAVALVFAVSCWHVLSARRKEGAPVGTWHLPSLAQSDFPYVAGVAWFLVALAPMIGIVQIGSHARADRFTYWPSVGLAIAMAWGLAQFACRQRYAVVTFAFPALVIGALFVASCRQVASWRDTESLFSRAISVVPNQDSIPYSNLGIFLCLNDRPRDGAKQLRLAAGKEKSPQSQALYAWALLLSGDMDKASELAGHAHEADAHDAVAWRVLAMIADRRGNGMEAGRFFVQSLAIEPQNAVTWYEYGNMFARQKRWPEAMSAWSRADSLEPYLAKQPAEKLRRFRPLAAGKPPVNWRTLVPEITTDRPL